MDLPILHLGSPDLLDEYVSEGQAARKLDLEEATEAEEWHALSADLDFIIRTTRSLAGLLKQREYTNVQEDDSGVVTIRPSANDIDDQTLVRCLWTAALVAYVRCFAHGKRVRLEESIFEGQPEHVLKTHRYYKDIRDKHIAHSVNAFEDFATGARVTDLHGNPRLDRVVMVTSNMNSGNVEEVENLQRLATWLLYAVLERLHKAEDKLIERVNSLTPDQLRRLPPLRMDLRRGYEAAKEKRS